MTAELKIEPQQILAVEPSRAMALEFIAATAESVGETPIPESCFPIKKSIAEEFCRQLGYSVSKNTIPSLHRTGLISRPPTNGSGHQSWAPEHLASLLASLESRGRWQPMHAVHDAKKSPWQIGREREQAGLTPSSGEIEDWPLRLILDTLASREATPIERECAFQAVLAKLSSLGVDVEDEGTTDG